ncbi:hypothetical protein ACIP10_36845 [Streptomyces galbus]|uniref:hypothetical protein n=1 Tax=Streptomyces galbus TaxID=33898 RepID=UPI0037F505DE
MARKTKARMLELMADAVLAGICYDDLPNTTLDRARELAARYRRTLLAHRDGAALVTGTYPAKPHTLCFADHLVDAPLEASADEQQAAWTAWTITYSEESDERLTSAVDPKRTRRCNGPCPTSGRTSRSASPSAWTRSFPASAHDSPPELLAPLARGLDQDLERFLRQPGGAIEPVSEPCHRCSIWARASASWVTPPDAATGSPIIRTASQMPLTRRSASLVS